MTLARIWKARIWNHTYIVIVAAALITLLSLLVMPLYGQTTTTTATVVDSDGTAWAGGTYQITFQGSSSGAPFRKDTGAPITTSYSGTLDASGVLSVTLTDVAYIVPANSTWQFRVCPAVSSPICGTVSIPVTGASENVSTQINGTITAPRISGGQGAFAYADVEVSAIPNNSYYNTTSSALRCYGSSWAACGGGGGAVSSVFGRTGAVTAQSGDYTAAQVTNSADVTAANTFAVTQTFNDGVGPAINLVGGASINGGIDSGTYGFPVCGPSGCVQLMGGTAASGAFNPLVQIGDGALIYHLNTGIGFVIGPNPSGGSRWDASGNFSESGNITVSGYLSSGVSGNTDLRGHLTLASGTASYTFTGSYTVAPTCVASDVTTAAAVKPVATTTTLTLTGTGTDTVNYICVD